MLPAGDLDGQKMSENAFAIEPNPPTSSANEAKPPSYRVNQRSSSTTEPTRPLGYNSSFDFRPSTPPARSFALRQAPSEASMPPSYHSRISLALPLDPNDVIGVCYQMSNVSRNVMATLPELSSVIAEILDVHPESMKWNMTMGRILALEERTSCITAQVEDLEINTKDIAKQYWKDNKRSVSISARDLIVMSDVLSSEINEIREVLSDEECLLMKKERARISNSLRTIVDDLNRLRQRVQMINSTSVGEDDAQADILCKYEIEKEKQLCWKLPEWESLVTAIFIIAALIICSYFLFSFFFKGNSKYKLRGNKRL